MTLLSWIIGVLFLLSGVALLPTSVIGGVIFIALAAILLPPTYSLIAQRGIKLSRGLKIVLCLVGMVVIGSTLPKQDQSSTKTVATIAISPPITSPTETVLTVDIGSFLLEFDKNQLAAEKKYKDKSISTTAYIKNISEDIMGVPYLSLQPSDDKFYFKTTAQCLFDSKDELLNVENGQKVSITGSVDQQSLGIVRIKHCRITN